MKALDPASPDSVASHSQAQPLKPSDCDYKTKSSVPNPVVSESEKPLGTHKNPLENAVSIAREPPHNTVSSPSETFAPRAALGPGGIENNCEEPSSSTDLIDPKISNSFIPSTSVLQSNASSLVESNSSDGHNLFNVVREARNFPSHDNWQIQVTIILENGHIFKFDQEVLKNSSNYFAKALATYANWIETQEGVFRLFGVEAMYLFLFKYFIEHGYLAATPYLIPQSMPRDQTPKLDGVDSNINRSLSSPKSGACLAVDKSSVFETEIDERLGHLIECYLLGMYLHAPGFQNAVMGEIFRQYTSNFRETFVPLYNLHYISDHTTSQTPLRRFVVDMLEESLSAKALALAAKQGYIPEDIFRDVVRRRVEKNLGKDKDSNLLTRGSSAFHEHKDPMRSPCQDGWCDQGIPQEKWEVLQDVSSDDVIGYDSTNYAW